MCECGRLTRTLRRAWEVNSILLATWSKDEHLGTSRKTNINKSWVLIPFWLPVVSDIASPVQLPPFTWTTALALYWIHRHQSQFRSRVTSFTIVVERCVNLKNHTSPKTVVMNKKINYKFEERIGSYSFNEGTLWTKFLWYWIWPEKYWYSWDWWYPEVFREKKNPEFVNLSCWYIFFNNPCTCWIRVKPNCYRTMGVRG